MKRTNLILFNNYDVSAAYEDAKQFLFERDDIDGNITESDIWEQVDFDEQTRWDDTVKVLKALCRERNLSLWAQAVYGPEKSQ